jgi:hypothetical protein
MKMLQCFCELACQRFANGTNELWVRVDCLALWNSGVGSSEIEVTVEDRTLKISGNRVKDVVNEGDTWHLAERPRGHFVGDSSFQRMLTSTGSQQWLPTVC